MSCTLFLYLLNNVVLSTLSSGKAYYLEILYVILHKLTFCINSFQCIKVLIQALIKCRSVCMWMFLCAYGRAEKIFMQSVQSSKKIPLVNDYKYDCLFFASPCPLLFNVSGSIIRYLFSPLVRKTKGWMGLRDTTCSLIISRYMVCNTRETGTCQSETSEGSHRWWRDQSISHVMRA